MMLQCNNHWLIFLKNKDKMATRFEKELNEHNLHKSVNTILFMRFWFFRALSFVDSRTLDQQN